MKLSTLVEHRNTVANVNFDEYDAFAKKVFDVQCMLEDFNTPLSHGAYNQMQAESILVDSQVENMHTTISLYLATLNAQIKEIEPTWLEASELVYQDIKYDDAEWTLERLRNVEHHRSVGASRALLDRISIYPTWEHAAMQIHPGFGTVTDLLKGTDPLYLVDTRDDLFTTVRNKWNPMYQNRLRYYTIEEFSEQRFSAFPKEQFGFILALDYFTYRTVDVIEQYLSELKDLLKPGGVMMFTFNNCDTVQGCRLLEHKYACYATEEMVRSIIDKLGYEVLHFYISDEECGTSWFEIKKPGELTTLRGGQTVSIIKTL